MRGEMRFTAIAVAGGLLVGVIFGGRFRYLGERAFRLWPFLAAGIVLQLPPLDGLGLAGMLISYACLLVFALANLHLVGMAVVALGIALNALVIGVNGGMPVQRAAVVSAGLIDRAGVDSVHTDHKHHLERDDDRLTVLADAIPLPPLREVVSFGDVFMAVGVADVLVHLLRRPAARAKSAAKAGAKSSAKDATKPRRRATEARDATTG